MASRFQYHSLIVVALLAFAGATRADTAGTILNINHNMELGIAGRPGVPGYRLIVNRLAHQQADENPDRLYIPMTVKDGRDGQCLQIPGYLGVQNYQIELGDIYIRQDCEIEIAFDARTGPDESGKERPAGQYFVDFRAMANPAAGEQTYPMIKNMGFNPTSQWQHFSARYNVKARTNFHTVWISGTAAVGEPAQNALYLDNFVVRKIDKPEKPADEMAIIPDRVEPTYAKGDTVECVVRAVLDQNASDADALVTLRSDMDDAPLGSYPVRLSRQTQLNDQRGVFQGRFSAPASRFGTFHCDASIAQRPLAVVGGEFSVLHPAVTHPRFSPGWRIGYNNSVAPMGRATPPYDYRDYRIVHFGSFERGFRIAQQAGMSLQRLWGHWRLLEPSEGDWRTDVFTPVLALNQKYNIETVFCIGGNLTVHGDKAWLQRQIEIGRSTWPTYLLRYHHDEGARGSINPPPEAFQKYLDFAVKSWGRQIHIWELFNEPGIGAFPADAYIGYLKQTYQTVKKHDPNDIVLGNGVTGDFGMNVIKWCQTLNAANPDYPNYMDGAAFHPYAMAMDYQEGKYGLYTQCVADISALLKIKKPLWNTECFYLTDARRPPIPWSLNQSHFGANEVQRHLLESLQLDIRGMTSFEEQTFVKRTAPVTVPVIGQEAAGGNALSWFLKDMQNIEALALNRYIKAGLLTDARGINGVGYMYDLRPVGSNWLVPAARGGVQVMDLFGNPIADGEQTLHLTYEPYYLIGPAQAVKSMMMSATLSPRRSVEINARVFQDQLYLEGRNISGVDDCQVSIAAESRKDLALPAQMDLSFAASREREAIVVQHSVRDGFDASTPILWRAASGDRTAAHEKINLLPVSGSYDIPMSPPKNLTLNRGSKAAIWADEESLHVAVTVADKQIVAAKENDLWNGDAVEIFIDTRPMEKLDVAFISQSGQNLDVWQHIFAATPSQNKTQRIAVNKSRRPLTTQANHQVALTDGGYTLTASIPWKEIIVPENVSQILGIDLEIDHVDGSGAQKESLGPKPGVSHQERLHYPLFRIPDAVMRQYRGKMSATGAQSFSAAMRVDVSSKDNAIPLTLGEGSSGIKMMLAEWLKEQRDRRLLAIAATSDQWQPFSFSFTPAASGRLTINLLAESAGRAKPWCAVDHVDLQGASPLQNGGFEQIKSGGAPAGWFAMNQSVLMHDPAGAADGDYYVLVNHDNRFTQEIAVEKDKKVTLSFAARAFTRPQIFKMP